VSPGFRRFQVIVAILLITGSIVSLLVAPVSWQLVLVYFSLGMLGAFFNTLDDLGKVLILILIVVGVDWITDELRRLEPQWHVAWWQPILLVAGSMALAWALRRAPLGRSRE